MPGEPDALDELIELGAAFAPGRGDFELRLFDSPAEEPTRLPAIGAYHRQVGVR
ncbi:hypothetical protein OIE67_15980 [Nonomuraea fuscirosea]|uniref:hypothetical protein n=1 Tax=Nonomuraea fuscirosea TaxID=1291556 RepID=UPI002DDAE166|nr:hypothetical protein [Nonomuraea fuscirosea]WSA56044.1 hypothetical protein OIE67_15980 [Nonomuraea fuscirosea]